MYIGLIDSGLGGLGFLKGIKDNNDYVLIMDKAFFPYGNKSKEFLIKRTLYLCNYLKKIGVDLIILACNTLSIIALDFIKLIYPNTIGVIDLVKDYFYGNNLFLGSKNTINYLSNMYQISYIDSTNFIYAIENNLDIEKYIQEVEELSNKYDNIIMGCTHFIYVKDKIKASNVIFEDDMYKKIRASLS